MTVRVVVKALSLEGTHQWVDECEFSRVPTVGEHIWLVITSNRGEECFRVVYVAHIPSVALVPRDDAKKCSAYIYAVEEDADKSIKDLGFKQADIRH